MRIEVVKHVRRPVGVVYAWCTDFQETDPDLSSVSIHGRRIVSRAADQVELEDHGVLGLPLTARYLVRLHPPDQWEADASSRMGTGHNNYRLTPEGDGTRIAIAFDLHPRGRYRIFVALAGPMLRKRLSRLWDDFVRDMEEGH